jgi:hypothetical protein
MAEGDVKNGAEDNKGTDSNPSSPKLGTVKT